MTDKQFQATEETEKLKRQQKRKALLFYPAIGLLFLGVMYLIFVPSSDKEGSTMETIDGYNADMPLPTETGLIEDKKSAYELAQLEFTQQEKRKTLDDYATQLNIDSDSVSIGIEEQEKEPEETNISSIQRSTDAYRSINRELRTFYEPPKDTEKEELKKRVDELTDRLKAAETENQTDKQLEIMEKSYKMASRYLNNGGQESVTSKTDTAVSGSAYGGTKEYCSGVSSVKKRVVSGLEQEISDSAFIATFSQNRNLGFITAVGKRIQSTQAGKNTIRACLYTDQTLVFGQDEGEQYVPLRLLEPMQVGNIELPQNSIVSGAAKLQSGRIGLQIVSVEHDGYIIPVDLTVYDTDGQPGINAPGSAETNAIKEAAANAGGSLGTSVSFTQNAGQQVAMDLTKGIMQSGSQYLSKKIRTVKIRLKAGYQVFLLTKEISE